MKNEAIEVLMKRRSVRKFKPQQITDAELLTVLDAGTYAPTARGLQTPYIVAVQDPAEREAVAKLNAKVMGADMDPYYGAPTVIIVLAPDDNFGVINASAVLTNMVNAAWAADLGSCWIHRPREMFAMPEGKELLRKWGLDENLAGVGSIALGYADMPDPAPIPRKEGYYRIIK